MDVYKKIQRKLNKGKTVLVETSKGNNIDHFKRYRLLTHQSAEYVIPSYRDSFFNNCCWSRSITTKTEDMKHYDTVLGIKIKKWQVLD